MNSAPSIDCSLAASSNRLFFIVACLALAASVPAAVPDGANAGSKTYTLFMGADLDVQLNKVAYHVLDVSGGSFVIKVDGKDLLVPMYEGPVSLRVAHSLKLTEASASIADLKGERAYTPGNDPVRKYMAQQGQAVASQAAMDIAEWNVVFAGRMANANAQAAAAGQEGGFPSGTDVHAAQQQLGAAYAAALSDFGNNSSLVGKMQSELDQGLFDAMDISFKVSAEKPLNSPYVVIVAQYREPKTPPGALHSWIYAKALEPIDSKPRKVRIVQGGFPQGFELERFQVHLYDRGQELATNVADKRVSLARDEAFQYVLIDYISSHKGASLPATPAMGKLPADLRTRLGSGQLTQRFFVKVSKDGLPVETYVDESCSHKVDDPYLLSVIRDLRFNPALEKGRPVEGIALLKLGDLRL
jgi:hypothetical protein